MLVDHGVVRVGEQDVKPGELAHVAPGRSSLTLTAHDDARVVLLGGPPFGESIVMWWNFVGRTHEEVVGYRDEWQAQITDARIVDGRFGVGERHAADPGPDLAQRPPPFPLSCARVPVESRLRTR